MKVEIPAVSVAFAATMMMVSLAALASSPDDITFPIPELGGCESERECVAYCDDPAHKAECDEFIERHNLDEERTEKLRQIEFPIEELGGCESRSACETYCEQPGNLEACLEFAEEHGLVDEGRDIETDRKMARLVAAGETPGGCQNERECIAYCMIDVNFDECLQFVEENEIVPSDELEMIKKRGSFAFDGPGGCTDEDSCKAYCSLDENFDECIAFIEEEGFMSGEELERLKQMGSFRGPGGCLMDECEDFCENPDNAVACAEFACDNGFIPENECEAVKKMAERGITGGPGGCRGPDECEAYCSNPENTRTCIEFSCEFGFMSERDCEQAFEFIESGGDFTRMPSEGPGGCVGDECEEYCSDPANAEECFRFGCEHGFNDPEQCETGFQSGGPEGEFEEFGGEFEEFGGEFEEGFTEDFGEEFVGPGGCVGEEECRIYCENNPEECGGFGGVPIEEEFEGEFHEESEFVEGETVAP